MTGWAGDIVGDSGEFILDAETGDDTGSEIETVAVIDTDIVTVMICVVCCVTL